MSEKKKQAAIASIIEAVEDSFFQHAIDFSTQCDWSLSDPGDDRRELWKEIEPDLPASRKAVSELLKEISAPDDIKADLEDHVNGVASHATDFGVKLGILLGARLAGLSGDRLRELGRRLERHIMDPWAQAVDSRRDGGRQNDVAEFIP